MHYETSLFLVAVHFQHYTQRKGSQNLSEFLYTLFFADSLKTFQAIQNKATRWHPPPFKMAKVDLIPLSIKTSGYDSA